MNRNIWYNVKRNNGSGDTRPRSELYQPQTPIITAAQSRLETPLFNPAGFPMLGSTISNSHANNTSSINKVCIILKLLHLINLSCFLAINSIRLFDVTVRGEYK
jgi:hypothetical protein